MIDEPECLPAARSRMELSAEFTSGICDAQRIASSSAWRWRRWAAGRETKEDKIDHAVGLEFHKRIGDRVESGEPLVTIHYNSRRQAGRSEATASHASFVIGETPVRRQSC